MTREEAFQRLEQMYEFCVDSMDADSNRPFVENAKAIKMVLHALCPNDSRYIVVTREQVECMRARWVINPAKQKMPVLREGFGTIECSKCESAISMGGPVTLKAIKESFDFCSACGAPMNRKAVNVLWSRLNEGV